MSRFISEVEDCFDSVCVSVRHENHEQDHCAGQHQVVQELYNFVRTIGLVIEDRSKVHHGGGFACVYIPKPGASNEAP